MTRILAGIVAWNEADTIAHAIRSVTAYVDGIVIVDAVFHGNEAAEGVESTDRQEARARAAAGSVPVTYVRPGRRLWEDEARNLYLDAAEIHDWILVIDGDETLVGDHRAVEHRVSSIRDLEPEWLPTAYTVAVHTTAVLFPGHAPDMPPHVYDSAPVITHRGWQPRLFQVRAGLRYAKNPHGKRHTAYIGERSFGDGAERTTDFLILNDHVRQSWERYQADYAWETHA